MFLSDPPENPEAAYLYQEDLDDGGYVMNLTRLWAWRPEVTEAFVALRALVTEGSTLSPREVAVIVVTATSALGDSYCSLVWGGKLAAAADPPAAAAVILGGEASSLTAREAALATRSSSTSAGSVELGALATLRVQRRAHVEFAAHVRGKHDRSYLEQLVERLGVVLDRPVRTLSKGNRQKIGVLLALMHRPELLILDEPTSGLDPLMQDEFARLMRETVAEGRTVFLSSHELDEVQRIVDRVAIIKQGRLLVTDTVEGLRQKAPRTIEFRFAGGVDPAVFAAIEGVRVLESEDGHIALSLHGDVAPLPLPPREQQPARLVARPSMTAPDASGCCRVCCHTRWQPSRNGQLRPGAALATGAPSGSNCIS